MLQTWLVLSALLAPIPQTPDRNVSPGDVCTESSEDFQEHRYEEQIPYCVRNVATETKGQVYEEYHVSVESRGDYTIDHIIPLSIGGSNKMSNLWPEHKAIKRERQNLEYCLYIAIRDGRIHQKEAIDVVLDAKFNRRVKEICNGVSLP